MTGSGLLGGKIAFVTGGASGLGRACAIALAGEGAVLVITDYTAAKHGVVGLTKAAALDYGRHPHQCDLPGLYRHPDPRPARG